MGYQDPSASLQRATVIASTSDPQHATEVEQNDVCLARVAARGSPYLSSKEAARYLGFHDHSLQNMRYRGGGPPFVRLGRQVRYHIRDLMAYAQHSPKIGERCG